MTSPTVCVCVCVCVCGLKTHKKSDWAQHSHILSNLRYKFDFFFPFYGTLYVHFTKSEVLQFLLLVTFQFIIFTEEWQLG